MQRLRIFLLLAVAVGLAVFAPLRDGRPLLGPAELRARAAGLAEAVPGRAGAREQGVRTIYRWRDADGTLRYGNVRPAGHPEAEELHVPVSWVEGAEPAPAGEPAAPGEPRDAAELLRASRELEGEGRAREDEMQRLMREASQ